MLLNIDWLERQIHTLFLKSLISTCIYNSHVKMEMQNHIYSDEPNSRQTLKFTSYTVLQITPKIFPYACVPSCFSHVRLCATPQTVAHQAPLCMGFSSQEYWSELPSLPPENLPNPRIQPKSPVSCIVGRFFTSWAIGELVKIKTSFPEKKKAAATAHQECS